VDDNATNRQILQKTLEYWGMKCEVASSAEAALALLHRANEARTPFGLMIVDCQMPEVDGFTLVEEVRRSTVLPDLTTIMLTSGGQRGDGQRCRELGIVAYLVKPVLQSELLQTLLSTLTAVPNAAKPAEPAARLTSATPLRILLAEDNVVNQRLAVRILEKRGHKVVVVDDGVKALAALERDRFDLVLMDVQMPSMDGVEATAAIRKRESAAGDHIPIIAMTAHAMSGDRQHFLENGMDGYISKPVHQEELFEVIESVLSLGTAPLMPAH